MLDKSNRTDTHSFPTQDGIFMSLQVGAGSEGFYVTHEGLWMGSNSPEDAPFKVDMGGNMSLQGYLRTGDASNDINAGVVKIHGGKIEAKTISTEHLSALSITAEQIAANTITADKIQVGIFVVTGGAAGDVNAGTTTIDGGKITANTITADQIEAGIFVATGGAAGDINAGETTIDGGKITTNTITADQIQAGIFISVGGAAGDVNAGTTTINGGKITSDTIETRHLKSDTIETKHIKVDQITTNRINNKAVNGNKIDDLAITNGHIHSLSATKLTAGTISVGGTSQPGAITIREGSSSDNFLSWRSSGGTLRGRIWTDSNGYMGIQGVGKRIYLYATNNLGDGADLLIQDGAATFNCNLWVDSTYIFSNQRSGDPSFTGSAAIYVKSNGFFIKLSNGNVYQIATSLVT